ncbi:TetR/AcrR family transcriptional regulator [Paenibacillus sp. 481]|uniref:TetR/AcrR family transcriptional regulator n=1 Tax=Paenibacillus sp. 481 TaxID=2835869 RepID=UPI001E424053|nr:TetR/AcrR family transcriptional regulator [Paenibacillus sp. 481]UHA72216.1 TetR/AcrR family transcriptional regulator [Paenibacillus sp. 481]
MAGKKELRAEETKRAILAAAGQLFAEQGFDVVTMRQIAKAAGCSHTAIYIYFKDKEALLHHLAKQPLQTLYEQMEAELGNKSLSPEQLLKSVCRVFISFCLTNRKLYHLFFMVKSSRVDEEQPALEVQQLRNGLFALLQRAVHIYVASAHTAHTAQAAQAAQSNLPKDTVLAYSRIVFFTLHGVIGTYVDSEEPFDMLMERLHATIDLALEVMLAGITSTIKRGE